MSTEAFEEKLKGLGDALKDSPCLSQAGEALKKSRHREAAEALKSAKPPTPSEGKRSVEKMRELARKLREKQLERLRRATSEMAQAISNADHDRFKRAAVDTVEQIKEHIRKRRYNRLLLDLRRALEECKARIRSENAAYPHMSLASRKNSTQSSSSGSKSQSQSQPQSSARSSASRQSQENAAASPRSRLEELQARANGQPLPVESDGEPSSTENAGTSRDPARASQEARKAALERALVRYQEEAEKELDREGDAFPINYREMIRRYFTELTQTKKDAPAEPPARRESRSQ
jgi:hypothetical protein